MALSPLTRPHLNPHAVLVLPGALAVAAALAPPPARALQTAPAASRPAAYHINRDRQLYQREVLVHPIDFGGPNTGEEVTVKLDCPLGYIHAKSLQNRSYLDQVVHSIKVWINGREVPFKEQPVAGETHFWCLDKETRRGSDQIAVRFTPAAGSAPAEMRLELTNVQRIPTQGAVPGGTEPRVELSPGLISAYQSMDFGPLVKVDVPGLQRTMQRLQLTQPSGAPAIEGILRFSNFFSSTRNYSAEAGRPPLVNSVFDEASTRKFQCNDLANGYVVARRVDGRIVRKLGGRWGGGDDGHAMAQEFDPALGAFIIINPSRLALAGSRVSQDPLQRIGKSAGDSFITYQDDMVSRLLAGITVLGEARRGKMYENVCGSWFASQGQKPPVIMTFWPRIVASEYRRKELKPGDPYYVTFPRQADGTLGVISETQHVRPVRAH